MKKFLPLLVAIFTIFSLTLSAEAAKKIVAVMPLENVSGYDTARVAEIMTEEIMVALQSSGKYSVVERTQMATILREQGFQNIATNPDSVVEIGKLTGANYSLIGKVTMVSVIKNPMRNVLSGIMDSTTANTVDKFVNGLKGKVAVDIRFVDNETGELVFAKSFTGDKSGSTPEEALFGSCREAADNFLKELTANLMGRVADMNGEELYIDIGTDSGLRKGDTLLIMRETSPIEVNGKIVGMKTIQIGKAKVNEVNEEYSICKIVSKSKGMAVRKGDVVKRG